MSSTNSKFPQSPIVVDVVMRCRNEMPYTRQALQALKQQQYVTPRILFIDCQSTDGSREQAVAAGLTIVDWNPQQYRPGLVLNYGMKATTSDIVAFINADAIALDPLALYNLVSPLVNNTNLCATFARQVPRLDSDPCTEFDYERAFGAQDCVAPKHGAFFSMAASAIKRQVWSQLPFDELLQYSEDVDWVTRVSALGWQRLYVPSARFEHSHNYTLPQAYRRRFGEGRSENSIFHLSSWSLWTDWLRPLSGAVFRDFQHGTTSMYSVARRVAEQTGYLRGRMSGV